MWILFWCLWLSLNRNKPLSKYHFDKMAIHSVITAIPAHNKGYPIVRLRNKRKVLVRIAGVEGKKYLQVGDSIVKQPKNDTLTVYRRLAGYTEVSVFDYKHSGLLKRFRLAR
ncbi:hypothetical protein GCM10022409_16330 [Hymenobacter glaciei]|uniref:Uncharacterized protein n=1 Tax=Hymenobacter glaciei TaxID=877209 RepID=A0ABP7TXL1_9BACT